MKKLLMLPLLAVGMHEAQAQITLEEICKKHIEESGGVDKIKKLTNITYQQQLLSNSYEIPQKIVIINNKAFYSENVVPGKKVVVCVVDNSGWQINPFQGVTEPKDLTKQELLIYRNQMNLSGPIYSYFHDSATTVDSLALAGKAKIGKHDCYVINIIYKNKYSEKAYISTTDFTLRKIKNSYGEVNFSNYKTVEGLKFPFSKEMVGSQGSVYVQVFNIKTNQALSAATFAKP